MASISNIATSVETRRLDRLIDLSLGTSNAATGITAANVKCRLMTANGSQTALGTEVAAGGGYSTGGLACLFNAASTGSATNSSTLTYTNMPRAETIVGVEIHDSVNGWRLHWGALTASKAVSAGDTFSIAASAITVSIT